jgi:hypothetical protein
MIAQAKSTLDPIAEYLQAYRDMRYEHGINSPFIDELKAAILFESECTSLPLDQRIRLNCLVRAIEHEQSGLLVRVA